MTERKILLYFDGTRDPAENLSREEELFEKVEQRALPELVRLWVNSECLVRGKAKSPKYGWYKEELAKRMGIRVFERETGGGVVYHDEGNLNWSIFLKTSGTFLSPTAAFEQGSRYVVKALESLGVPAQFSPPNRIDAANRKVSGMAAKSTVRTLLTHGTLLLRSDQEKLNLLCIPPPGCPPVANLSEWVDGIDPARVKTALAGAFEGSGFSVITMEGTPQREL